MDNFVLGKIENGTRIRRMPLVRQRGFNGFLIRVAKHQWHPRSIFVAKHQWPPRSIFVKEAIITPDSGTLIKRVAGANADWTRIFGGVD